MTLANGVTPRRRPSFKSLRRALTPTNILSNIRKNPDPTSLKVQRSSSPIPHSHLETLIGQLTPTGNKINTIYKT